MLILNKENFDEALNGNFLILVDFYADWCGPCRMMAPVVEGIAKDLEGKIVVAKLNVDDNPDVCEKYGIRNIPTILFFKNGEIVDKQVGAVQKDVLIAKVEGLL